jgi:hypothetical protein
LSKTQEWASCSLCGEVHRAVQLESKANYYRGVVHRVAAILGLAGRPWSVSTLLARLGQVIQNPPRRRISDRAGLESRIRLMVRTPAEVDAARAVFDALDEYVAGDPCRLPTALAVLERALDGE